MKLVNGKELAEAWLNDIAVQVAALGVPLHLAAVCACPTNGRVGDDAGLRKFVALKQKAAQSVGVQFSSYFFDVTDETGARQTLQYLAVDETVQGIFIELPLPKTWNTNELLALIPAEKDVDALTERSNVPEPAVRALEQVLEEYGITTSGLSATVVGNGRLVGKPIATWLRSRGANVSFVDIDTPHPEAIASKTGLVATGVGKPGLVIEEWIQAGATVIDFGYAQGKGDVDIESVQKKAGLLTPVPGGMGPLVIAAVLENLVDLATRT